LGASGCDHLGGAQCIANFLFIPYYPFWSILIIAVDVFVIWAIAAHGREVAWLKRRLRPTGVWALAPDKEHEDGDRHRHVGWVDSCAADAQADSSPGRICTSRPT
jgi:hypothetical protein